MIRSLAPLGVTVPDGFALTADAYHLLLDGGFRGRAVGVRTCWRAGLRPRVTAWGAVPVAPTADCNRAPTWDSRERGPQPTREG